MTRRRGIVFVNGKVDDYAALARWVQPGDYLVAADGGALHCLAIGRQPDVVVGDLDSLPPEITATLAAQGVVIERHPPAKDQTDLELAIDCALREGVQEVLLLGALGGRLDQTLANLLILAQREWPAAITVAEGQQVMQILRSGEKLELAIPAGSTVSVIPLSPAVTGITYTGLEYPLTNAALAMGSTRGISNVVAATPATIAIATGLLLVVYTTSFA